MDILQAFQDQYIQNATLNAVISRGPFEGNHDLVPQISEGAQVLSRTITLASANNRVLVKASLWGQMQQSPYRIPLAAALFRGSTCIDARHQGILFREAGDVFAMTVLDSPGSAGPHIYSVRAGVYAHTEETADVTGVRLNGWTTARLFGGVSKCTLTVLEIG